MKIQKVRKILIPYYGIKSEVIEGWRRYLEENKYNVHMLVEENKFNNIQDIDSIIIPIEDNLNNINELNNIIYASMKANKTIIGIFVEKDKEVELPKFISNYADSCIIWNEASIIDVLNGETIWQDYMGEELPESDEEPIECIKEEKRR